MRSGNEIRLCIIGCGAIVEGTHARVLPALAPRLRVTACYDTDVRRARGIARLVGAQRAAHADPIMEDTGRWDAALIATPPMHHAPLARELIGARKHVLVEKPFVTSAADAEQLVAAAASAGTRLLVGHFRRYYPSLEAARALVEQGAAGDVERVEIFEGMRWGWPARTSYAFTSPDGGVALDTGSHALDTALRVLGADRAGVGLEATRIEKEPATEPSQHVTVEGRLTGTSRDLPVHMALSRVEPTATAVKLRGTAGWIVVPAGYSDAATLVRDGRAERVAAPADAQYLPPDPSSAFYCEFLDFVRSIDEPGYVSRIDAVHFIGLAHMLESITAGRSS